MGLNPYKLKKDELLKRLKFRCKHHHNGLSHYQCFDRYYGLRQRIGFLDIEASNLNATFGIVYTYCIKELDGKLYKRAVTSHELYNAKFDKLLLMQLIRDLENFDKVVVHYGGDRKFDFPMVRSRSVYWRLPFPEYKFISIADTHTILKNKFRLHSNRLETACDFYNIPAKGHKLKPDIWLLMITGNRKHMKKALRYIMRHNVEDVLSLEALWKKIHKFVREGNTSI